MQAHVVVAAAATDGRDPDPDPAVASQVQRMGTARVDVAGDGDQVHPATGRRGGATRGRVRLDGVVPRHAIVDGRVVVVASRVVVPGIDHVATPGSRHRGEIVGQPLWIT